MKMFVRTAVLCLSLSSLGAWALPPEVEADRLMIQAKAAFDKKDYTKAADAFAQADKLGVSLPEKFYLQYSNALSAQGKWSEAHDVLDAYLNKFSTNGKLYKEALAQYMLAEDKAKRQPAAERLVLNSTSAASGTTTGIATNSAASSTSVSRAPAATGKRVRPNLPFQLSDEVWRVLENSEAYRNAPDFKPLRVNVTLNSATDGEYLHSKTRDTRVKNIVPIGSGYAEKRTSQTLAVTFNDKVTESRNESSDYMLMGGLIWLANLSKDGQTVMKLKRIDELRGSLFPLRIGAEMSMKYEIEFVGNEKFNTQASYACKLADKIAAASLHANLTGNAWVVHCEGSSLINGTERKSSNDEHYLEDLGVMRSTIGEFDLERKTNVLPTPGYKFTLATPPGKYSSTSKYEFERFDWSAN